MSNKNKQPYVIKAPSQGDTGTSVGVPPRYQPPPLPTGNSGILKQSKDAKQYANKVQENNVKNAAYPQEPQKSYPQQVLYQNFKEIKT